MMEFVFVMLMGINKKGKKVVMGKGMKIKRMDEVWRDCEGGGVFVIGIFLWWYLGIIMD